MRPPDKALEMEEGKSYTERDWQDNNANIIKRQGLDIHVHTLRRYGKDGFIIYSPDQYNDWRYHISKQIGVDE